jgi:hypothetical protein
LLVDLAGHLAIGSGEGALDLRVTSRFGTLGSSSVTALTMSRSIIGGGWR